MVYNMEKPFRIIEEYFAHRIAKRDAARFTRFINLICGYVDFYQQFIEPYEGYKLMCVPDGRLDIELPIPFDIAYSWSDDNDLDSLPHYFEFKTEHIRLNKVAWQWWDDYGSFALYTCYIGYGHQTKKIVYCNFEQYRKTFYGEWERY